MVNPLSHFEDTVTPAQLIAQNLAALPHPDGVPRQLPGFQTRLLPEPMQEQVSRTAGEIGDAIIHLLTMNGYAIVKADQLSPATPAERKTADVYCNHCTAQVLSLNITNPAMVKSNYHFTTEKCPHA